MLTYVFDIDGTLANADHRLHWIKDPAYWVNGKPNWDEFLSSSRVAKDTPILETWKILDAVCSRGDLCIFITGRPEREREMTEKWLREQFDDHAPNALDDDITLYMRKDGDRRPSSVVKGELLDQARLNGFEPVAAFEDRRDDCRMWREKGLLCYHVAEGDY